MPCGLYNAVRLNGDPALRKEESRPEIAVVAVGREGVVLVGRWSAVVRPGGGPWDMGVPRSDGLRRCLQKGNAKEEKDRTAQGG
ncbi:hypothetical protein CEP54_004862 [Fusarium duplospermum]|uniref:Uncharacterized protein n=1 Tax=Fusarium duplospermum TaxID=1325734 RepID=A0A428QFH9_9HYPO|nr:hypothetical protein CEP54_004862 [Fusarium duplospermum]